ncbi:UbiA family prenyltransferase [Rubritalea spongiae]
MKWWIYQKERFPIFQHGPLVLAFSACAVCYSALITNTPVELFSICIAFVTCLFFFLQLRIADEFKDAKEDAQYRPYRPVPRGLVSLKELGIVFVLSAGIQLLLALYFFPTLVVILLIAWAYLALMSAEFFVRDWLKSRPITYLWTHMLIMPLVDLYATACQWMPMGEKPLAALSLFLIASFFNGIVIEIGRKLRLPDCEEEGVPTYSKLWGLSKAAWIWFGCLCTTGLFATAAAHYIRWSTQVICVLTPLIIIALVLTVRSSRTTQKTFETLSGIWTMCLYLILGVIPFFVQ